MSSRHSFPSVEMTSVIKFCNLPDRFYTSISNHTHAPPGWDPRVKGSQNIPLHSPRDTPRPRCPGLGHRQRQDGSGTSPDEQMCVPSCPLHATSQQCVLDKCIRHCTGSLVGKELYNHETELQLRHLSPPLSPQHVERSRAVASAWGLVVWGGGVQKGRDSAYAHRDSQVAPS